MMGVIMAVDFLDTHAGVDQCPIIPSHKRRKFTRAPRDGFRPIGFNCRDDGLPLWNGRRHNVVLPLEVKGAL